MTITKQQLGAMVRDAERLITLYGAEAWDEQIQDTAYHVKALAAEVERLAAELDKLRALHAEIVRELCGHGYEIDGWHSTAATALLDRVFALRGWDHPDTWEPAVDTPNRCRPPAPHGDTGGDPT